MFLYIFIYNLGILEINLVCVSRDAVIYALGVGACGRNAVEKDELKYIYHEKGQQFVKQQLIKLIIGIFGFLTWLSRYRYDPHLLLHGQQYIEIYKPLPSNASVNFDVLTIHFSGKAAIAEVEIRSYENDSGELLCMNRRLTAFLRGAGGFSKSSPPFSYSNYPKNQTTAVKIPETQPLTLYNYLILALLYMLSGDYNPLHADPMVANVAGLSQPILHGLCTLGFAVRAIVKGICRGDPDLVKCISGRFLLHVYPGETLITKMWLDGFRVIYQTKEKERNHQTVLSGFVDLHRLHKYSMELIHVV
ncbi:hypothetical protein Dsin_003820 [Dipteronia sinensis]|uniref:MaoC-like domain-containing protein n=1 Tax=Dipteronia sinensis TaxID=43782 RepID=A0AAE0EL07_9ROSI|nr:hypothetical protein Dsin_003820 [Dipteronia sinensis]